MKPRSVRPRIALPQPTSHDLPYNQRSWPQYARAVELSGGEPVLIELAQSSPRWLELARSCDGVLLPGSPADVDPALYGAEREPECAAADPARERLDYLLLEDAVDSGKPVLGICYGLQSLNAWRGGSLLQDLTPMPVNHGAGGQVAIAHTALVAENSLLASLLTPEEAPARDGLLHLPVNSSHHQSVAAPGDSLRVVARCLDDGVIEALELDSAGLTNSMFHVEHQAAHQGSATPFLLGVQWHPERSWEISAASRALFRHLIAAAASFRLGTSERSRSAPHPGVAAESTLAASADRESNGRKAVLSER